MSYNFNYQAAGPTITRFHNSDAYCRFLRGPVGSGKSVACVVECLRLMMGQEPGPDGIRKSRLAVIRNTTPQLKTTTIETWKEWLPEEVFGKIKWDPPISQLVRFGDVECEVLFLALDNEKDIRKLLSLELTFAWINEAREIIKPILDAVTQRVGRYPGAKRGGPTRFCVIADTNPPGPHHWWAIMSGEVPPPDYLTEEDRLTLVCPESWEFFVQPPAMNAVYNGAKELVGYEMNPDRENKNVAEEYYRKMMPGKSKDWISVYLRNNYADLFNGRPVYPDFNEGVHVTENYLEYQPGEPVYVGIDFGLTPAAVFGQKVRRRWLIQRELVSFNSGIAKFGKALNAFMSRHYPPDAEFVIVGDPAGDNRVQTDEATAFDTLRNAGVHAKPARTNDPGLRIDTVTDALISMADGRPNYLISSRGCPLLVAAKKGGYAYDDKEKVNKNEYSHVSDAEQYMMDGAGDTRRITHGRRQNTKPTKATVKIKVMRNNPFGLTLQRRNR